MAMWPLKGSVLRYFHERATHTTSNRPPLLLDMSWRLVHHRPIDRRVTCVCSCCALLGCRLVVATERHGSKGGQHGGALRNSHHLRHYRLEGEYLVSRETKRAALPNCVFVPLQTILSRRRPGWRRRSREEGRRKVAGDADASVSRRQRPPSRSFSLSDLRPLDLISESRRLQSGVVDAAHASVRGPARRLRAYPSTSGRAFQADMRAPLDAFVENRRGSTPSSDDWPLKPSPGRGDAPASVRISASGPVVDGCGPSGRPTPQH